MLFFFVDGSDNFRMIFAKTAMITISPERFKIFLGRVMIENSGSSNCVDSGDVGDYIGGTIIGTEKFNDLWDIFCIVCAKVTNDGRNMKIVVYRKG